MCNISFCKRIFIYFAVAGLALANNEAIADSTTFTASKDNTLYESSAGDLSNGAGEYFFAGNTGSSQIRRSLLSFDIASKIPAGATIDSVNLTLNMSRAISEPIDMSLHQVLSDWGEGNSDAPGEEGGGTTSAVGDATWLHTFFDTGTWTTSGGDFEATASAVQSVGNIGFYTWTSTSELVANVQAWLDNPSSNFGWMLRGDEATPASAKRFDSRENPVEANRPMLTVEYTIPEPSGLVLAITSLGFVLGRRQRNN